MAMAQNDGMGFKSDTSVSIEYEGGEWSLLDTKYNRNFRFNHVSTAMMGIVG